AGGVRPPAARHRPGDLVRRLGTVRGVALDGPPARGGVRRALAPAARRRPSRVAWRTRERVSLRARRRPRIPGAVRRPRPRGKPDGGATRELPARARTARPELHPARRARPVSRTGAEEGRLQDRAVDGAARWIRSA